MFFTNNHHLKFRDGILCKFSQKEYLESLQKGNLYMKPLGSYATMEGKKLGEGIYDPHEGLFVENVDVEFHNEHLTFCCENISLSVGWNNPVFCCSELPIKLSDDSLIGEINIKNQLLNDFGDKYALLISKKDFIERIRKAVERLNIRVTYRNVEYQDFVNDRGNYENYPNILFRKDKRFEYQCEFRVVLDIKVGEYYELPIGDISDISLLVKPVKH